MKHLSPLPALWVLLCPLLLALGFLFFPLERGGGGAGAATPKAHPTTGNIAVALTDSPSPFFQSLLLNLVSVRLNKSTNTSIGSNATGWVTVPIGPFASPSPVGELQVDLNNIQQNAQILNTTGIKPGSYEQVELNLDPNNPASVVPNCPSGPSFAEGCVSYPVVFSSTTPLRVAASIPVGKNTLTSLVIDFDPGTIVPPSAPGGSYTFNGASISVPSAGGFLGTVGGSLTGAAKNEVVTALLSGTDTFITSIGASSGRYSLALPASPDGTTYDLVASGSGSSYGLATVTLVRGGSVPPQNFTLTAKASSSVSGTVSDQCSGTGIEGATVNIYGPSGANCSADISGCIVVATTATDEQGNYPMPSNKTRPLDFTQVPAGTYGIRVSMAGYDPVLTQVVVGGAGGLQCGSGGSCSFSLSRGTITGTVNLSSAVPPGTRTTFQVFAEDQGTNKLEAALPVPVQIRENEISASFSLNVPTKVPSLDLFASTVDLFQGAASPNPGHSIAVLSGFTPPAACATVGGADFAPVDCVGHASVSGKVAVSPDNGTTVRMSKDGVQLMESAVGFDGTANARAFSFCAPADTYTLGRYESGVPQGVATTVVLPEPAATSTPCPSICGTSASCPGICSNTPLGSLL